MKLVSLVTAIVLCASIAGCVVPYGRRGYVAVVPPPLVVAPVGVGVVEYDPDVVYAEGVVVNFDGCFGCVYRGGFWYGRDGRRFAPHARRAPVRRNHR